MPKVIALDVRHLEHPLPLEQAVDAFKVLSSGELLHMINNKNPLPLFEIIQKQSGFFRSFEDEEGIWHILLTRDPMIDLNQIYV